MTYLDEVRRLDMGIPEDDLIKDFCPESFLVIDTVSCEGFTCEECWDRKMPVKNNESEEIKS